ncbi:hypothetical protein B0H10DRAFT_94993 [Mycena sp. CBHHK59/15]|nr:hypothetical protein B0H10DRAFT_94993 [Mycena sp. CBHHK59/15]
MKSFVSFAAAASFVPAIYGLIINTPTTSSLVVCKPIALSWSNETAPYYLSIIPDVTSVDIATDTSISLEITDSTGTIAYSDAVTIQSGSDRSCVSSTAASADGSATTTATGRGSGGGGCRAGATATKATATASGTTTGASSSSSSTSSSSASYSTVINYGLAGFHSLFGIVMV